MHNARLKTMQREDLETVLVWRNHPEVRRYMYTDHIISFHEHQEWFNASANNKNRHLKLLEINGNLAGFLNITQLPNNVVADWGFYLAPEAKKGTGTILGQMGLKFAFEELELHKVCGQALAFNHRSVKFHQRLGFQQEGLLRDQHFDGERFHSVLCFGLLHTEWRSQEGACTT